MEQRTNYKRKAAVMFIADKWKDYEVIDTSCGEKLERWGDYLLVRPDPQVIWNTQKKHPGWKERNGHYHRSAKGGGEWEFFNLPKEWSISYDALSLTFHLKPFSFKHTGLFPEQAANWDWFSEKIRTAGRPVKVLNLFAYTGGSRGQCDPCGRFQGNGHLGQGKRKTFRTVGGTHSLAGR